jgi:membrane protein YqaA with SNARE-associated domain
VTAESSATDSPVPLAAAEPGDDELRRYVLRSVVKAGIVLVLLFAVVGGVGMLFREELVAATERINELIGFAGLAVILFLSDAFITPVPPDALLVVIANSELAQRWPLLILALGLVSIAAGSAAWFFGVKLGDTRLPRLMFGRFRAQNRALVARYGRWAVGLGAITPIPFSLTCWTAGMFRMRYDQFFWMSLLRIPRFYLYYVAIAYSDELLRALF